MSCGNNSRYRAACTGFFWAVAAPRYTSITYDRAWKVKNEMPMGSATSGMTQPRWPNRPTSDIGVADEEGGVLEPGQHGEVAGDGAREDDRRRPVRALLRPRDRNRQRVVDDDRRQHRGHETSAAGGVEADAGDEQPHVPRFVAAEHRVHAEDDGQEEEEKGRFSEQHDVSMGRRDSIAHADGRFPHRHLVAANGPVGLRIEPAANRGVRVAGALDVGDRCG